MSTEELTKRVIYIWGTPVLATSSTICGMRVTDWVYHESIVNDWLFFTALLLLFPSCIFVFVYVFPTVLIKTYHCSSRFSRLWTLFTTFEFFWESFKYKSRRPPPYNPFYIWITKLDYYVKLSTVSLPGLRSWE